ncbi:MAG: bifunctional diguanylate cyclase/phosphodiesterase [Nitrospirota bacterium]|nr:bifunctional diguanylate cyclase/phosphodiesterase [Nitrospirota bacterium]
MEKVQKTLIATLLLLTCCILLAAFSLGAFLPGWGWEKRLMIIFLIALSPLPLMILVFLLRTIKEHDEQTRRFATRDALTDLYNQHTFWDLLNYEIERSKRQQYRFSLMLVDIDNFKAINDRYGHETGDRFLRQFSVLFKNAVRKGDIPARYAGDNFTAILPLCDESQARTVALRLLESMRRYQLVLPGNESVQTTASIGIATFPDHAADAQDLYLLAESMMVHAKSTGKDRVSAPCEDVNIGTLKSAGAKSIMVMEAVRELRIVPYFQPIINVADNTVLAYEVLTRIVTADRVIPAAEFIDVAESMGAISKINSILMERSFSLANQNGYRGTLFINLSPKALMLADFLPTLRAQMTAHDFDPSRIVFEITERDAVKNPEAVKKSVNALRNEGFRFAIDDFGSGYATFHYIRLFEVDFLKVDGDFIRNMGGDGGMDRAIVMNIASLAGHLGIKTIAEYVESAEILSNVRSSGIQYAQGYFIDRPSPHMRNPAPYA